MGMKKKKKLKKLLKLIDSLEQKGGGFCHMYRGNDVYSRTYFACKDVKKVKKLAKQLR